MKHVDRFNHIIECIYKPWLFGLFHTRLLSFIRRKHLEKYLRLYLQLRFFLTRKPILPIVEYLVTTNCTMQCKECNTFIPHFSRDAHLKSVSFETFRADLDKLLGSVDYIYALGLVGGEPLLCGDLAKMLEYASVQKQIRHIFIATNCTIEPSPELLRAMRHKKFAVQLSNYKNVIDDRSKFDKVRESCARGGVRFSLPHGGGDGGVAFIKMPKILEAPTCGPGQPGWKDFADCICRNCAPFFDGRFLPCTVSVYIVANRDLPEDLRERLVDVRALPPEELTQRLIDFWPRGAGIFCPYCDWENSQMTTFAEQQR